MIYRWLKRYFYLHGKKMPGAVEGKEAIVQPHDLAAKP
jgi:hypothetical protein